jgi:hypothetical protein
MCVFSKLESYLHCAVCGHVGVSVVSVKAVCTSNFSGGGWGYHHYKYEINLCQFFLPEQVTCLPILSAEAFFFHVYILLMLIIVGVFFMF